MGNNNYSSPLFCCCLLVKSVRLFVTPWNLACQALLSMGFLSQEYWNGLPFPSPGYLSNLGIKAMHVSCLGRWILYY